MVAKKTAEQHSASSRSTSAAKDVSGKKSTAAAAPRTDGTATADKAVKSTAAVKKAAAKKTAAKRTAVKTTATKTAGTKAPATKTTTAKKAAAKTTAAKKSATQAGAAKKTAAKAPAKKAVAKKAAAEKTVVKKAPAKKAVAGKALVEETVDAGAVAEAAVEEKDAAVKTAVRKAPAKKAAASKAQSKPDSSEQAAKQTGARSVGAKKAVKTVETVASGKGGGAVPKARNVAAGPGELAIRPGEDPWTPEEVAEARTELQSEILRLRSEIATSEEALAGLMRDSGNGAGDDDADTGSKNITREHEMALANNAREMLEQSERALERLDAGTYGLCESCGNPIGKARMQAFPRATLCVECKQKQERRT